MKNMSTNKHVLHCNVLDCIVLAMLSKTLPVFTRMKFDLLYIALFRFQCLCIHAIKNNFLILQQAIILQCFGNNKLV